MRFRECVSEYMSEWARHRVSEYVREGDTEWVSSRVRLLRVNQNGVWFVLWWM